MVIWSGKGIFALMVIAALIAVTMIFLPENIQDYGIIASFFLTAIFCWVMGKRWNQSENKMLVDPETGKQIRSGKRHSLFFINLEYCAFIFIAIGIVALVRQFT